MSWAHRIAATTVTANASTIHQTMVGNTVRSGGEALLLTHPRSGLEWKTLRYGMMLPVAGHVPKLVWSAQIERLEEVEMWARLVRQRFAIPVDAYVEKDNGDIWRTGDTAWMVGHYDTKPGRGAVIINEAAENGRKPVLLSQDDALAWLGAKDWDAVKMLKQAPRESFRIAAADVSSALSAEARRTQPGLKAA